MLNGVLNQKAQADIAQFDEEMNFPYKQVQFMQSLLQNLPLETQQYTYASPSQLADAAGGAAGLIQLLELLLGQEPPKKEEEDDMEVA